METYSYQGFICSNDDEKSLIDGTLDFIEDFINRYIFRRKESQ